MPQVFESVYHRGLHSMFLAPGRWWEIRLDDRGGIAAEGAANVRRFGTSEAGCSSFCARLRLEEEERFVYGGCDRS